MTPRTASRRGADCRLGDGHDDGHHRSHPGQDDGPQVPAGKEHREIGRDVQPAHVGAVGLVQGERDGPPRHQEEPPADARHHPPDPAAGRSGQDEDDQGAGQGEDRRQQMAEDADGQDHGRRGPEATRLHPPDGQAEEDKGEGQTEREGVLPGHGRVEVPAVDGEGLIEEEGQGEDGENGGTGPLQPGQPTEEPGGHRKGQGTEDRHQLEGDVERDDVARRRRPGSRGGGNRRCSAGSRRRPRDPIR